MRCIKAGGQKTNHGAHWRQLCLSLDTMLLEGNLSEKLGIAALTFQQRQALEAANPLL